MLSVQKLSDFLALHAHPENAQAMSAYVKNRFVYFGIKSTPRRDLFRIFLQEKPLQKEETATEIISFARDCYSFPERELHYCGIELIAKNIQLFRPEHLSDIEFFITHHSWWDTVDLIATRILGPLFKSFPELINISVPRWLNTSNIWLQRSCILFQLKYKAETDLALLSEIILQLKDHPDFFIKKAIGWVLREYSKTDRVFVLHFVRNNQLSALSQRESLKHLHRSGYSSP